ncbi:hypothetical protein Bca4012_017958 [Brassica carinata]
MEKMSCEARMMREVRRKEMMEPVVETDTTAQPPLRYRGHSNVYQSKLLTIRGWTAAAMADGERATVYDSVEAHVDASNTGEEEIDKVEGSSAKKMRKC